MKKIKILMTVVILFTLAIFVPQIKADVFPKPFLEIELNYLEDRDVYIELLVPGKVSDFDENDSGIGLSHLDEPIIDYLLVTEFEGYVSASLKRSAPYYIKKVPSTNYKFDVSYRYPSKFKVIIFDKTNNAVYITKEIEQSAFSAKMTIKVPTDKAATQYNDFTVIEELNIKEKHNWVKGFYKVPFRMILTIIVELFILFLFQYRKKESFIFAGITNIITQTILMTIIFSMYYLGGPFIFLVSVVLGEFIVITTEMIAYGVGLKEKGKMRAILYGLVANLVTIMISIIPFIM